MKLLLIAAIALSLILTVSAQCDVSAATTCLEDFARMVSKNLHTAAVMPS